MCASLKRKCGRQRVLEVSKRVAKRGKLTEMLCITVLFGSGIFVWHFI